MEADGSSMPVSAALAIINDVLGEVLDGAEADLDADTRFALTWFTEHGYDPGPSGDADSVARAKNTSLAGVEASGVGEARAGKFRLYERSDLDPDWSPADDSRPTVWEATQYLAARFGALGVGGGRVAARPRRGRRPGTPARLSCCTRQPATGARRLKRAPMTLSSLPGRACVSALPVSPPRLLLRRPVQPSRCCYDRAGLWWHTV